MTEIVEYIPEHFKNIDLLDIYSMEGIVSGGREGAMDGSHIKNAYTLLINGKPIIIWGNYLINSQTMQIWALISKDVKTNLKEVIKNIKHVLSYLNEIRVQVSVISGYTKGCRFAEYFGFKKEGLMHKYGVNKKDYCLYARVVE